LNGKGETKNQLSLKKKDSRFEQVWRVKGNYKANRRRHGGTAGGGGGRGEEKRSRRLADLKWKKLPVRNKTLGKSPGEKTLFARDRMNKLQ